MTGRVGVLASGSGTILEALVERGVPVAVVIADRPCRALEIGRAGDADALLIDRREWGGFGTGFDREGYTASVTEALTSRRIDLVAMAGFGTILGRAVHDELDGRVLNTHPSLLPSFKGWHAVEDALAAGVPETGCTVHVATLALDDGPILAQERVAVLPGDTVETLHERIKVVERRLYPETVLRVLADLEVTA